MEVDLLLTEAQGAAPVAERLAVHAEPLVEGHRGVDVRDGQDEVVERRDAHAGTLARDRRTMEPMGIEPMTSALPALRSPS